MDVSRACTEALFAFLRFHEGFNRSTKMAAVGLCLIDDALARGMTYEDFARTTYATDALWGGMPVWTDPPDLLREARADLGQAGLVRAFSAFDKFMDDLSADLDRWAAFQKRDAHEPADVDMSIERAEVTVALGGGDDFEDRALRFYDRMGWSTEALAFLLPVYRYYRLARDCIAHRGGIVSPALAAASEKRQWADSIDTWNTHTDDWTPPQLVELQAGDRTPLVHRDAILASSLLVRIAQDMNRHGLEMLGERGVLYLTARRTLLDNPPKVKAPTPRSAVRALHHVLFHRYHVVVDSEPASIALLRDMDLWESCRTQI